ncbi:g2873 [Coccomyxa elongata]
MSALYEAVLDIEDEYRVMLDDMLRFTVVAFVAVFRYCSSHPKRAAVVDELVVEAYVYILLGIAAYHMDPGFCLDRFLAAASRWVLPKRLPHGRSGRGVRPTAVCVGASTAGGDTGAADFTFAFS